MNSTANQLPPDGTRLAFSRTLREADAAGATREVRTLMTLAVSGGRPREVYKDSPSVRFMRDTAWTKDGGRLLFIGVPGTPREIYSVSAEGGEPQPTGMGAGLHDLYFLSMHPDGKQIVFADEQWRNQLWVLNNLRPPDLGEVKLIRV